MNLKTTKKITEEQILTFYNLNDLLSKNPQLQNDVLLMDFRRKIQEDILRTLTCLDVMFRITPKDKALHKLTTYEEFEKLLNQSSHGHVSPVKYFKVWELYETRFKTMLESYYDFTMKFVTKRAINMDYNPKNPIHIENTVRKLGFKDFESLMIKSISDSSILL